MPQLRWTHAPLRVLPHMTTCDESRTALVARRVVGFKTSPKEVPEKQGNQIGELKEKGDG